MISEMSLLPDGINLVTFGLNYIISESHGSHKVITLGLQSVCVVYNNRTK